MTESKMVISHYSIAIPGDCYIRDVTPPLMDFMLYEIGLKTRANCKMMLYFGNAPDFPTLAWTSDLIVKKGKNYQDSKYRYMGSLHQVEGEIEFNGLRYKERYSSPFPKIHYYSIGKVENGDAEIFVKIIDSIRVVKNDCW